ncbi:casein kinase 2 regulatory subunit [Taxawa tesnikishii (nom. ined.)]|nr:casein kinase 2 regulatory subunit [Dothideales sp. JES 119]
MICVYPAMLPQKTQRRYEPRIYGFKVHAAAALQRWQDDKRQEMKERLRARGIETGFENEDEEGEGEEEDDEEDPGSQEGIDDMFEGRMQQVQ